MQEVVYTHGTIRIAKLGKAELASGLGRAGFAVHGLLDALAVSKFGFSKHANLFLRSHYQHDAVNYQHNISNRQCFGEFQDG
jgi:hypothetical protein